MSAGEQTALEQPCFAGVVSVALSTFAQLLGSLRQTAKKNSLRGEKVRRAAPPRSDRRDDLVGEAHCSSSSLGIQDDCFLRLRGDYLLLQLRSQSSSSSAEEEEGLPLEGAAVESTGTAVTLIRNARPVITMNFECERAAGLWATKLAVACGNTESIAKLFSIQRRRINSLEQYSMEATMNNEEVERCLNFLSREYVEMRYQVRKTSTPGAPSCPEEKDETKASKPDHAKIQDEDEEPMLIEDIDPCKRHSEPEKEPLYSARLSSPKAQHVLSAEEPEAVSSTSTMEKEPDVTIPTERPSASEELPSEAKENEGPLIEKLDIGEEAEAKPDAEAEAVKAEKPEEEKVEKAPEKAHEKAPEKTERHVKAEREKAEKVEKMEKVEKVEKVERRSDKEKAEKERLERRQGFHHSPCLLGHTSPKAGSPKAPVPHGGSHTAKRGTPTSGRREDSPRRRLTREPREPRERDRDVEKTPAASPKVPRENLGGFDHRGHKLAMAHQRVHRPAAAAAGTQPSMARKARSGAVGSSAASASTSSTQK
mmetsp:Transcript_85446/g.204757  ORF Transcript_85446/g.204757 Transcript_85446/m.204757 type:complete len:538 (-) Transcript_85446:114-1727(-)